MPTRNDNNRTTYRVAWFIGPDGAVPNATVILEAGRVREVGSSRSPDAIDLGEVAIIPGLVNAHTHMEFSLLDQPIPTEGRFTDWIRSVVKYRREHTGLVAEAIRVGIEESIRCGTTLIGDIATSGWSINDYLAERYSGVVFQELLGLTDERVASQLEVARQSVTADFLTAHAERRTPQPNPLPSKVRDEGTREEISFDSSLIAPLGLSPHAPYSVHPELLQEAVKLAQSRSSPLAMHLAETEAELELLAAGTGEFREMLDEFGLWRDGLFGDGRRPLDYLVTLAECPAPLIVHGNYLDEAELQFLAARPHMTLVYCPRTHAAFGHRNHPWRRLRELGGSVALGTDSRASNPDLSLFTELQFLAKLHPDVSHLEFLELATTNGHRALRLGRSNTNERANLTVIRLNDQRFHTPEQDLFAPQNQVVGTMIAGRWRFAADGLLP